MESVFDARRLHEKFYGLRRSKDRSEVGERYFVLIPSKDDGSYDQASCAALEAYADACEGYAPVLAADLREWVNGVRVESRWQAQYLAEWER